MDTLFSTRLVMSGWVYLGVLFFSMWESKSSRWDELMAFVRAGESERAIATAFVGVIVGVGAPPAIGFLFDRLVAPLTRIRPFRSNIWDNPQAEHFANSILLDALRSRVTPAHVQLRFRPQGYFIAFFYTYADEKFIEWTRRRTSQQYASLSSIIAILGAIGTAYWLSSWSVWVSLGGLLLVTPLLYHAWHGAEEQRESTMAWIDTIGRKAAKEFVDNTNQP